MCGRERPRKRKTERAREKEKEDTTQRPVSSPTMKGVSQLEEIGSGERAESPFLQLCPDPLTKVSSVWSH